MAHTAAWDELSPAGTDLASSIDNFMREAKRDIRERLELQHYWDSATAVGNDQDGVHKEISITPAVAGAALLKTNANQSLTGSQENSAVDLGITWNTTGAPSAVKVSVTDTASDAASRLLDLQVDGNVKCYVDKSGNLFAAGLLSAERLAFGQTVSGALGTPSIQADVIWNTSGTPTAWKLDVTDTASNAASLLLDLQVGSSSKFKVTKGGALALSGGITFNTDEAVDIGGASGNRPRHGYFRGLVQVTGSNAGLDFGNRSGGTGNFQWYATGDIANLYHGGAGANAVTISSTGALVASGAIQASMDGTQGNVQLRKVSTTGVEVHIRGASGKDSILSFTEHDVADRWAFVAPAGNTDLLLKSGGSEGTTRFTFGNTGLLTLDKIRPADGTVSAPAYSFSGASQSGFYYDGLGSVYTTIGGVARFRVAASTVYLPANANGAGLAGPGLSIGYNGSGGRAPGWLSLYDTGATERVLWSDSTGVLRIGTSAPVEGGSDTGGTVVGTQTSSRDTKVVLSEYPYTGQLVSAVLGAVVKQFKYKNGAFRGEEFYGIVTDDDPLFGMDRDERHPGGKSLNVVTAIGALIATVQHLNERLQQVEVVCRIS